MIRLIKNLIKLTIFILLVCLCGVYFVYNYLYPMNYRSEILKYAQENEIDPYLVYAIINVESGFNTSAESKAEARGLMQIREITADWAKEHIELEELNKEDYFKPEINIKIGTWYLSKLSSMYNGDVSIIAAAYNAGVGNVTTWIAEGKDITHGDIPFAETKKYVERVNENIEVYKVLYGESYSREDFINAIEKICKLICEKTKSRTEKLIDDINKTKIEKEQINE